VGVSGEGVTAAGVGRVKGKKEVRQDLKTFTVGAWMYSYVHGSSVCGNLAKDNGSVAMTTERPRCR
jgi:hypothetical protein